MFKLLVEKELKEIMLSPKFAATFGVCSLLILISIFIGAKEYQAAVDQYNTAVQLTDQEIQEATSWRGFSNRAYREPDPMQVFVSGVNNDIGRFSNITERSEVKLRQSIYSDDPLFALFRFIDFTFIVQVVLSLFAILFTYDAINGERERGTLKLAFSNSVPRAHYLGAKFLGSWLGLTLPLLVPILLGMLIVVLFGVPIDSLGWTKVAMLVGASILYFTFFIMLGLFVSALTRRSNVSFLVLLVAWVLLVLIVPRAGAMAAGQFVYVPSVAEVEMQKERYATDQRNIQDEARSGQWRERMQQLQGRTDAEREQLFAQSREQWRAEEEAARAEMEVLVAEYYRKVNEDLRNKKAQQEELAFLLSRFSPASAFQLTAMNLAGTNTTLKSRYEYAMNAYRTEFSEFADAKEEEQMRGLEREARFQGGGHRIRIFGGGEETIDASEMPQFTAPSQTMSEAIAPSVVDLGLLALYSIVAFAGAFVSFLRYDVR